MLTLCCHRVLALQGRTAEGRKSLPMRVSVVRTLLLERPASPGDHAHVAAASGLARVGDWLHVVPDDSLHLATFELGREGLGRSHPLFPDPQLPSDEKQRKQRKPDLESLTVVPWAGGQALLSVGSGSTPARRRGVLQPLTQCGEVEGRPRLFDLAPLYAALPFAELNIEGVAATAGRLFLGQRGNGAEGVNAIIELDLGKALSAIEAGSAWEPELILDQQRLHLGEVRGVRLTLTDLARWGERGLLLSAAAEDTPNTYDDGEILGSVLGRYSLETHEVHLASLDGPWKVEGVEPVGPDTVLMVTDGDDPGRPALLLQATGLERLGP